MAYCLIPSLSNKLKQEMIEGKISPEKLALMSSAERRAVFTKIIGEENAKNVNSLFESKLLLKNQKLGMINWAKKVLGISKPVRQDLIAKIQRLDNALSPREEAVFLEDLVNKRLGVGVSFEEARVMADLYTKVDKAKTAMESGGYRLKYGRAVVDLNNYFNQLKTNAEKFSIKDFGKAPFANIGKGISELAGNAKAMKASMDNSAIFNQGWKVLWTNPKIWAKNAKQSFKNIWDTFGGKEVMDELNADIVSRPNSLNDYYKKAKLNVGTIEEAFPTTLPEKIPGIGRAYKASQDAYTAFIHKTRADVFDKYIDIAKKTGVELSDEELLSIGKLVNSLTGRGSLGKLEPIADVVNNVFFSPRYLKSQIDVLTQPLTGAGGSNFVRKMAAMNLLKIIMGTAAVLGIAKVLKEDSVDFNPLSSDFGKIKVGNTRFEVTGGLGSLIVLVSRVLTASSKSSTTGQVTKLDSGKFGSQTVKDVIINFFQNKLSPVSSVIKDLVTRETFDRTKPTIRGELSNLSVPLSISTGIELWKTPEAAPFLLSLILSGLGINTNTYEQPQKKESKSKFKY